MLSYLDICCANKVSNPRRGIGGRASCKLFDRSVVLAGMPGSVSALVVTSLCPLSMSMPEPSLAVVDALDVGSNVVGCGAVVPFGAVCSSSISADMFFMQKRDGFEIGWSPHMILYSISLASFGNSTKVMI